MTKKQAAGKVEEAAGTEEQGSETRVQLTLQDLTLVANIINVISQRGAIRAEEMSTVGAFYEKLVKFLQQNGVKTTAEAAAETVESTDAA